VSGTPAGVDPFPNLGRPTAESTVNQVKQS